MRPLIATLKPSLLIYTQRYYSKMSTKKQGLRIRGIYATALARLLLDSGFRITDPSDILRSRFFNEIDEPLLPPVATIKDRDDKESIVIIGEKNTVRAILGILQSTLKGVSILYIDDGPYTSFKILVKKRVGEKWLVSLPDGKEGYLIPRNISLKENDVIYAHIIKPDLERPILKPGIAITGRYVRIIQGERHGFSSYIRDPERRSLLLSLVLRSGIESWGVKFRSIAAKAEISNILQEISYLKRNMEKIIKEGERHSPPIKVTEGEAIAFLKIGFDTKRDLDDIRSKQITTIPLHHFFKSIGNRFSDYVDFAENILHNGLDRAIDPNRIILYYFRELMKNLRSRIYITLRHEKIDASTYVWHGDAKRIYSLIYSISRRIYGKGIYNGLNLPKEEGDYSISLIAPLSRMIIHMYFTKHDELKGIYVNLNTPLELSPSGSAWYLDMEIDVIRRNGQRSEIIDKEKLFQMEKKGTIDAKYVTKYFALAKTIAQYLDRVQPSLDNMTRLILECHEYKILLERMEKTL